MKAEDIEPYINLKSDRSPRDPHKYYPNPRQPAKPKKPRVKREPVTYISVIDGKRKYV